MRIAYINIDEVNQDAATKLARKYGCVVCALPPKEEPPEGRYDAVLYNLDDVPKHLRRDLFSEILWGHSTCPIAVHGYGLSEDQAASLRLRGVAVAQRLHPELFRLLYRTVIQNLASVPPEDALVEETWINLPE
jgi:hypothetical protein